MFDEDSLMYMWFAALRDIHQQEALTSSTPCIDIIRHLSAHNGTNNNETTKSALRLVRAPIQAFHFIQLANFFNHITSRTHAW
jgi:hypothetical protein